MKKLLPVRKILTVNDDIQKVKDDAFNLLSYRERSYYELKDRLLKKGHKEKLIEEALDILKTLNYINDERFARKWIKNRIKNKPRSRLILKKELQKKGIQQELIKRILNELVNEKEEVKMGVKLASKWVKRHIDLLEDREKFIFKLKCYLSNKGFSCSIIYNIIKELNINKEPPK